jgi:hypothetical protein
MSTRPANPAVKSFLVAGIVLSLVGLFTSSSAFAAPPAAATTEPVEQLPDNVKASVALHGPRGSIVGFEHHVDGRRHLYYVDIKLTDGTGTAVLLASGRGQYLGMVEEANDDKSDDLFIEPETAPQAVKEAVAKYFGKTPIDCMFMEVEEDRFIYVVEQSNGDGPDDRTRWASFALHGELMEEESEVMLADVPAAVKEAVTKAHPNAKMVSASLVKEKGPPADKTYYSIEISRARGKMELSVTPDGQIFRSERTDEADSATRP